MPFRNHPFLRTTMWIFPLYIWYIGVITRRACSIQLDYIFTCNAVFWRVTISVTVHDNHYTRWITWASWKSRFTYRTAKLPRNSAARKQWWSSHSLRPFLPGCCCQFHVRSQQQLCVHPLPLNEESTIYMSHTGRSALWERISAVSAQVYKNPFLNIDTKLASSLDITVLIGSKSSRPCPVGFASVNKNRKFGRSGRSPASAVNISCSTTRSALSVRVCQALWSEMLAIAFFIDDSSVYFVKGKTTSTIWLNVTRATWFPVSVTLKLWTNATRKFCRSLKCDWSTLIDLSTTSAISATSPWKKVGPETDKVY